MNRTQKCHERLTRPCSAPGSRPSRNRFRGVRARRKRYSNLK